MINLLSFQLWGTFLLSIVLFVLPGIGLGVLIFGRPTRRNPEPLVWGIVLGLGVSSLITLVIASFWGWRILYIVGSLVVLGAILLLIAFKTKQVLLAPRTSWTHLDWLLALTFSLGVLVAAAFTFSAVGKLTPNGYAFPELFGYDFILRNAYSAHVGHGLPLENPYFAGHRMYYYLLYYIFPAFAYNLTGLNGSITSICILYSGALAATFVFALFSLIKICTRNRLAQGLALTMGMFASSYNSLYVFAKRMFLPLFPSLYTLAKAKGLLAFSDLSNTWFRYILVEPQAILCLLVVLLAAYILLTAREFKRNLLQGTTVGLLVGIAMGTDGFIGFVLATWILICGLRRLVCRRACTGLTFANYVVGGIVAGCVVLIYFLVGMYAMANRASAFNLRPLWFIIVASPVYFPLDYGPLFIFGVIGIYSYLRRLSWKAEDMRIPGILLILAVVCVFFIFFVGQPVQDAQAGGGWDLVLRKAGMCLPLPLLLFSAVLLSRLLLSSEKKWLRWVVVGVALTPGLATFGVDFYHFRDVDNPTDTVYLSVSDKNASDWLRRNTPINTVIQCSPYYPGSAVYHPPIPAIFAERKIAAGPRALAQLSTATPEDVQRVLDDVQRMFETEDLVEAVAIARRHGIDYVYVGPHEKEKYGNGARKFATPCAGLMKVYDCDGVSIFQVLRERPNPR